MTRRLLPLLFLLGLPFVSLAHAQAERIPYACDNGSRLAISFSDDSDGRPQATLHFADAEVVLPQVPAASGALYRAGDIRLHTKGDDAFFEDGKNNTRRCARAANPPPAPAAAGSFIAVAGSVTFPRDRALPPDAVLIVRIQDTARAGAPALTLAEQRIDLRDRQAPIPFQIVVDRDLLHPRARVTAAARIEHRGKLLFISNKVIRAIVDGQPQPLDIALVAVGDARKR